MKRFLISAARTLLPTALRKKLRSLLIPPGYILFSGGWGEPVKYNEDGFATSHNADFLASSRFIEAYNAGAATGSFGGSVIRWRVFNACTLARYAIHLDGDFVEAGVNKGGVSLAVIKYTDFARTSKRFFLLDTFKGFDVDLLTPREREKILSSSLQNRYVECYEEVCKTFAPYSGVKIIRGAVPYTLQEVTSSCVAFMHLDMNCAGPERAAIEYFWDRLVPGGIVLLDDYGWDGHADQKKAMDDFAERRNLEVINFPTGQGLIIKPV